MMLSFHMPAGRLNRVSAVLFRLRKRRQRIGYREEGAPGPWGGQILGEVLPDPGAKLTSTFLVHEIERA